MENQDIKTSVENMILELKAFIATMKSKQVEVTTIHAYVFHYEAENDDEVDEYLVNVKVCYSFDSQETFYDGITFEKLEDCQKHISYIENQLIQSGYEGRLLVDVTPN